MKNEAEHVRTSYEWRDSITLWTIDPIAGDKMYIWLTTNTKGLTIRVDDKAETKSERTISWQEIIDLAQELKTKDTELAKAYPKLAGGI